MLRPTCVSVLTLCTVTTDSEHSKNNVEDPKLLEISEHPEIDIRGKVCEPLHFDNFNSCVYFCSFSAHR